MPRATAHCNGSVVGNRRKRFTPAANVSRDQISLLFTSSISTHVCYRSPLASKNPPAPRACRFISEKMIHILFHLLSSMASSFSPQSSDVSLSMHSKLGGALAARWRPNENSAKPYYSILCKYPSSNVHGDNKRRFDCVSLSCAILRLSGLPRVPSKGTV